MARISSISTASGAFAERLRPSVTQQPAGHDRWRHISHDAMTRPDRCARDPIPQPHNSTILLVDDNPTNLQLLFGTLKGLGHKLLVAKSGEDAPGGQPQWAHPT